MAGDYIQLTIFPDMPIHEQLAQVYIDGLYGPLAQIGTFLHTISSQQELIENGRTDDPRRRAIIDTIFEIYKVTDVFNSTPNRIISEYDKKFWDTDFSDLMDELDFLDDTLQECMRRAGMPNNYQKFGGSFAANIAKMIIIANLDDDRRALNFVNLLGKGGPTVNHSRQTGACMSLYELLRQIINRESTAL